MKFRPRWVLIGLAAQIAYSAPVTIRVNAAETTGPWQPVWNYFGYDEPNYTYAANGRKLIHELAGLSSSLVYIRTHNLLTTGTGEAGLKIGSTNAYTEDPQDVAHYDWAIVDKIFDTYTEAGAKPLVEIGFMPKALSVRPEPYVPLWKPGENFSHYFVGWTFPPKDYEKWGTLVSQFVQHLAEKYGESEVESWPFEVWNEPDIAYWHGTPEEYDRLYDFAAAAVKKVLPRGSVGGPASTGPGNPKGAAFLRQFLKHCADGSNAVTGERGSPLDFISYHVKGHPDLKDGQVRMGLAQQLKDAAGGFAIVREFEKFRNLPIILSESDPEGCAACSAQVYPQNAYRNGTLYPGYEAAALKSMLELATNAQVRLKGVLTWAFEFEGQPYFAGFRSLATNGVDKPVLDLFRMLGLMRGERVTTKSDGALPADSILQSGVREHPDVDAVAVRGRDALEILIWNYQDFESGGTAADIQLQLSGLPQEATRMLIEHFRIDQQHSNSYALWQKLGSPQQPTADQRVELETAGQLQLLESPKWMNIHAGSAALQFVLPSEAVSLVRVSW